MRDNSFSEQRKALRRERRKAFLKNRKQSGSVVAGLLFLVVGTLLLLRAFGIPFPEWFFTWPMILIGFGFLAGASSGFRDPGWVVLASVGTIFLLDHIWPNVPMHRYIWPVLIIGLGLIIILAPRRNRIWKVRQNLMREMKESQDNTYAQDVTNNALSQIDRERKPGDNWLDLVTIFSNVKKLVYSKNFKGGDIVSIFAGAEINLTQADITGPVVIELVQIFGGAKLIIPPHWQVHSDSVVSVFGGIEDKRTPTSNYDENKVIILNGTTIFGGIEIKSFE